MKGHIFMPCPMHDCRWFYFSNLNPDFSEFFFAWSWHAAGEHGGCWLH